MGFFDRIFITKKKDGNFEVTSGGPSMGSMMSKGQGAESTPAEPVQPSAPGPERNVVADPSLHTEAMVARKMSREEMGKAVVLPGGAEAVMKGIAGKLQAADDFAARKAREHQDRTSSLPSIEEAAEDEKRGVMLAEAEADAWSRIAGIFRRAAAEPDALKRHARVKAELEGLRVQTLGQGPEADSLKILAIEEVEKQL